MGQQPSRPAGQLRQRPPDVPTIVVRAAAARAVDASIKRRRDAENRRPIPPRLPPPAPDIDEQEYNARYSRTMWKLVDDCEQAPDDCEVDGVAPPRIRRNPRLLPTSAPQHWRTNERINPRYDCAWGDNARKPECQKLLRALGANEQSYRRRENADRRRTSGRVCHSTTPQMCEGRLLKRGRSSSSWYVSDGTRWIAVPVRKTLFGGWTSA